LAPFVAAAFVLLKKKVKFSGAAKFLLVYTGILACWFVPSLLLTGTLNLSSQSPDQLNRLLHRKGEFLILTLPDGVRQEEWRRVEEIPYTKYSVGDLLALYARHPWRVVVVHTFELAKLLVRFDEIKIVTYLGIWQPEQEWQRRFVSAPLKFFQTDIALFVALAAVGSLTWLTIIVFAIRGFRANWRRPEFQLVLVLVTYSLLSVLTVDNTSARLRSCTNYAFVFCAAVGYHHWREQMRRMRTPDKADSE
jgi:hypothetical protein